MKMGETTKILGHTYTVEMDKNILDYGDSHGMVFFLDQRIVINPNAPDSIQLQAFVHEIIEVAKERLELDIEHSTIQALGEVIAQALTSNNLLKK